MDVSARTLRLLGLLQSHRFWAGDDLATRLGVSLRTLRRDIDRLRELGYPVDATRGVAGGYQLSPGASLPPLTLDEEEAVALAVGLQSATQQAPAGLAEASLRALAKVVQVLPKLLRRRVEVLLATTSTPALGVSAPPVDAETLVVIARACRDAERVLLRYAAADGTPSRREVEPVRLVPVRGRWYLVCYDLARQDWRTLRVDRVSQARPTGAPFRPRQVPGGDPVAYVQQGLRRGRVLMEAEVVVFATPEAVRAQIGRWAQVTAEPDGTSRVRMEVDSLAWVAMAVGSTGVEFKVVGPPELADLVADWADRFGRAAG